MDRLEVRNAVVGESVTNGANRVPATTGKKTSKRKYGAAKSKSQRELARLLYDQQGDSALAEAVETIRAEKSASKRRGIAQQLRSLPNMFNQVRNKKRLRSDSGSEDASSDDDGGGLGVRWELVDNGNGVHEWVRKVHSTQPFMLQMLGALISSVQQPVLTSQSQIERSSPAPPVISGGNREECCIAVTSHPALAEFDPTPLLPTNRELDVAPPMPSDGYPFSRDETLYLFQLLACFGTNFVAIHDRFCLRQCENHVESLPTLADVTFRIVSVSRAVLEQRLESLTALRAQPPEGAKNGGSETTGDAPNKGNARASFFEQLAHLRLLVDRHPLRHDGRDAAPQFYGSYAAECSRRAALGAALDAQACVDLDTATLSEALEDLMQRFAGVEKRVQAEPSNAALLGCAEEAMGAADALVRGAHRRLRSGVYCRLTECLLVTPPPHTQRPLRELEEALEEELIVEDAVLSSSDAAQVALHRLRLLLARNLVLLRAVHRKENVKMSLEKLLDACSGA